MGDLMPCPFCGAKADSLTVECNERLTLERGMFFILDSRSCVGNCAMWWGPDRKGYVCDLDEAGVYTEAEARSHRDTDVAVPCEIARHFSVTHCRSDWLREQYDFKANGGQRETRVDSVAAIGEILSAAGCSCECGHHAEEHEPECERCLACRIGEVVDAAAGRKAGWRR